jgi:hypothetical protein
MFRSNITVEYCVERMKLFQLHHNMELIKTFFCYVLSSSLPLCFAGHGSLLNMKAKKCTHDFAFTQFSKKSFRIN